jgi:hypothetical protein
MLLGTANCVIPCREKQIRVHDAAVLIRDAMSTILGHLDQYPVIQPLCDPTDAVVRRNKVKLASAPDPSPSFQGTGDGIARDLYCRQTVRDLFGGLYPII